MDSLNLVSDSSWNDALYSPNFIVPKNYAQSISVTRLNENAVRISDNSYHPQFKINKFGDPQYSSPQTVYQQNQMISDHFQDHRQFPTNSKLQPIEDHQLLADIPYNKNHNIFSPNGLSISASKNDQIIPKVDALIRNHTDLKDFSKILSKNSQEKDQNPPKLINTYRNDAKSDKSLSVGEQLHPIVLPSSEYDDVPIPSSQATASNSSGLYVSVLDLPEENTELHLLAAGNKKTTSILQDVNHQLLSQQPAKFHVKRSEANPIATSFSVGHVRVSSEKSKNMKHILYHLETDTTYQVTVSVENKYGWSDLSDIFTFYTKPGKDHFKDRF